MVNGSKYTIFRENKSIAFLNLWILRILTSVLKVKTTNQLFTSWTWICNEVKLSRTNYHSTPITSHISTPADTTPFSIFQDCIMQNALLFGKSLIGCLDKSYDWTIFKWFLKPWPIRQTLFIRNLDFGNSWLK